MKRAASLWTLTAGCRMLDGCAWACFIMLAVPALALTANNPYGTIVERNAFALKSPPPPTVAPPPVAPASNVELRGITTLLGRPQVLLNFKIPAKPPEPPKDRSLVMDVGDREGDVEVLEINPASGSVRIRNQGNELAMNLKDNAAKPQSVPGLVAPALPLAPGTLPGVPRPANISPTGNPAVSPTDGGGGTTPTPRANMPTRSLRSSALPTPAAAPAAAPLSAVEQAAIMEIERERTKEAVAAGKMPPLPPLPYSDRDNAGSTPK